MKKLLVNRYTWFLFIFSLSVSGYAQNPGNAGVLGKVTIDEKGQVTFQSIAEQEIKTAKVIKQTSDMAVKSGDSKAIKTTDSTRTGKFPLKSYNLPEMSRQVAKSQSSGSNTVIRDNSPNKLSVTIPQDSRTVTSTTVYRVRPEEPNSTLQSKNEQITGTTSRGVKAAGKNLQMIYESYRLKPLTSASCELLSVDNVTVVRWYGEKDYFITPTTTNPQEYQRRIGAQNADYSGQ